MWETKCYTCLRNQTLKVRNKSLELENSPKVMWSFYNSIRWCIYVTFPTKLISTKLCNALTKHERVTFFVRHQTDLGIFEIAIFLLIYQLQFLFLCDQVLGGESFHNGLKSIDTDHYCCCYTKHNIARVTLFCEKPNVTRASMFNKSYYKIMAICGQSLLNAYQWTYYI